MPQRLQQQQQQQLVRVCVWGTGAAAAGQQQASSQTGRRRRWRARAARAAGALSLSLPLSLSIAARAAGAPGPSRGCAPSCAWGGGAARVEERHGGQVWEVVHASVDAMRHEEGREHASGKVEVWPAFVLGQLPRVLLDR